jgi:hypothetical protein
MKRLALLGAALAAAVAFAVPQLAGAQDAPISPSVSHYVQPATLGYYRGKTIEYLDLGPVKLAAGNKVAPIWAFTNGASGQFNIIDTVPGQKSYTPLWGVRLVTWKSGETPRILRSKAAVEKALQAGQVTVKAMPIVVNCPVL